VQSANLFSGHTVRWHYIQNKNTKHKIKPYWRRESCRYVVRQAVERHRCPGRRPEARDRHPARGHQSPSARPQTNPRTLQTPRGNCTCRLSTWICSPTALSYPTDNYRDNHQVIKGIITHDRNAFSVVFSVFWVFTFSTNLIEICFKIILVYFSKL